MLNEDIVNLSRSLKSMMTNMEVIHLKSKELMKTFMPLSLVKQLVIRILQPLAT